MTAVVALLALQAAAPAPEPRRALTLAVVPVSFADARTDGRGLDDLLLKDVAAWYRRVSSGTFALRGRLYPPVALDVSRADFRDLAAAARAVESREGEATLSAYDGAVFVLAGPVGARGGPLWPRHETVRIGERRIEAVVLPAEAGELAAGIAAHEIMHLLGLPDKYDDPRASVGRWCILGTGYSARDPAPPCADCRIRLGWTSVQAVDPRTARDVELAGGPAQALRVPLNAEGTEALLLEMRDRLFVWHTGGGATVELVARLATAERLTPFSERPFRPRTAGAWNAWVTDVKIEGGRATFRIGPQAVLTPDEEARKASVGKRLGD